MNGNVAVDVSSGVAARRRRDRAVVCCGAGQAGRDLVNPFRAVCDLLL